MIKLISTQPVVPLQARHPLIGTAGTVSLLRRKPRALAPPAVASPRQRTLFLDALAAGSSVQDAVAAADVPLEALVRLRRRDRRFDQRWHDIEAAALAEIASLLEAHVIRHLRHPGTGPDAPSEALVRHSSALGQWLLEKRLPEQTRASRAGPTAEPTEKDRKPARPGDKGNAEWRQIIAEAERRLRLAEEVLRESSAPVPAADHKGSGD